MTAVDILSTLEACYFGIETAFGGGATNAAPTNMIRAFPIAESFVGARAQVNADVKVVKIRPYDLVDPIHGYKSATVKFAYLLQVALTVLNAAATVPSGATEPPLWVVMRAIMGGNSVFAGSAVVSASDASTVTLTAAQGARFPDGQLAMLADAVQGFIPFRCTQQIVDTLKVWPALPNVPAGSELLTNMATFYLTKTNTLSLCIQNAKAQDANYQTQFVGGTGTYQIKMDRGAMVQCDFDLNFASFVGPSALSLGIAKADDTMAEPIIARNAVVYLQAPATTTRVSYPVESFELTLNTGMKHIETLTAGVEGVRAVARTEGLYDTCASLKLTMRADLDLQTYYDNRTHLSCFLVLPVDTAAGRRMIVIDLAQCVLKAEPSYEKGANNLLKTIIMLEAQLDHGCTATTDLACAGVRIGLG